MTAPRAWVVGGSEGIGLAIAERLVGAGYDVLIASRSRTKLDLALAALDQHRQSPQQRLAARELDVTDAAATASVLSTEVTEDGPPGLVVNTAGYARPGWAAELPEDELRGMVEVNLVGTMNVARAALPHLRAGSQLILTSSMAGLTGVFGYTAYCATKFGVIGFAEALRREVKPHGINVRVLCPPNTLTPGFEVENQGKPAEILAAEETVRTLTADQVADEVMKRLRSRKMLIIPGRDSQAAAVGLRHLPWLADRVMRRRLTPDA